MNKLILCTMACLVFGCAVPREHWQIHNATACITSTGHTFNLVTGEPVVVIAHQPNGRSRVLYKNDELVCPTTNVWVK